MKLFRIFVAGAMALAMLTSQTLAATTSSPMPGVFADDVRAWGQGYTIAATFTPAAASHTGGDVVGGAQEFAIGAPAGSILRIVSASLLIAGGTVETTAWTLHLYSVTPPSAIADDAAFDVPSGDRTSYLGSVALAQVVDLGATLYIDTNNIQKQIKLTGTSVFGYLVNGTTLTPQAVAHTVTLQFAAF